MFRRLHVRFSSRTLSVVIAASLVGVGLLTMTNANANQLPNRSLTLSNANPAGVSSYLLGFKLPSAETLGSIKLEICSEGPLIGTPCTAPAGLNMSAASLGTQTGAVGFSIASTTSNTIILSHAPASVAANLDVSYQLKGITNPNLPGSYFGRLQTYAATNANGAATDAGGVAFVINNSVQVTVTVPPYLYFCVGITVGGVDCATAQGNYINFGNFSPAIASAATSQMVAGTNADTGYSITANGNTLTSGNNTIPALTTPNVSRPGVSQFGLNLVANLDPRVGRAAAGSGSAQPTVNYSQANLYKFVSGDIVARTTLPDAPRNYTVSYLANVTKTQSAGIYATTVTYICTGGF